MKKYVFNKYKEEPKLFYRFINEKTKQEKL